MTDRPKIGIGVIIIKDNKVLFGKRKNSHGDGTWSLPGGHLEFGESWEDCALREVEEEVGITINNLHFVTATNDIFQAEEKHYVTLFVKADYVAGEVTLKEPEKCEQWDWFSWDNLPQPLFLPIENLLRQKFNPLTSVR